MEAQAEQRPVTWSDAAMDEMGLFSSRLIGRWPKGESPARILPLDFIFYLLIMRDQIGAPMELHPSDDPNNGLNQSKDPEENKRLVEMKFGQEGLDRLKTIKIKNLTDEFNYNPMDQTKCPYASHMRKTGPRDDYEEYTKHVMMRRGIPYGDWCGDEERGGGVTKAERGLLFVSYQSSIDNGFRTQQKRMSSLPWDILLSNFQQGGPILLTAQQTSRSRPEGTARELTLLSVKFTRISLRRRKLASSMPNMPLLPRLTSPRRSMDKLPLRSSISQLIWPGCVFPTAESTSSLLRFRP